MTLISVALMQFEKFEFLLPVKLNLLPNASVFIKISTVNKQNTMKT